MRTRILAIVLLGPIAALPSLAHAQQPWFDAGNQAMIMHNGDLLEQQTAPDQDAGTEQEDRRPREASSVAGSSCDVEEEKARLRLEYDRRVEAEGEGAARTWLRQAANELGRRAARGEC